MIPSSTVRLQSQGYTLMSGLARHLPPREDGYRLPLPIVLDTHLRMPVGCKLIHNATSGTGVFPLVFCARALEDDTRKRTLEELGVKVVPVELDRNGEAICISIVECDPEVDREDTHAYRCRNVTAIGLAFVDGRRRRRCHLVLSIFNPRRPPYRQDHRHDSQLRRTCNRDALRH